jgi:hypothetical protein
MFWELVPAAEDKAIVLAAFTVRAAGLDVALLVPEQLVM